MRKDSLQLLDSLVQEKVDLEKLFLDPKNPRLPKSVKRDQAEMLEYLAKYTSIEDLMNAIHENDYFAGEPLITVKENKKYYVIEGNRRLTALKLLNDLNIISRPSARMIDICNSPGYTPKSIPVIVLKNRESALPYLGYRHITGVKQWEPLAKARYIKDVFDTTDEDLRIKQRYKEVADIIGSRPDHIKRNLDALAVYNIIEDNNFFDIEELDETSIKFAVLSTAIADNRISEFLGIDEDNPVVLDSEHLNISHIKDLTTWMYKKDDKGTTRLGESRNLRQLAAVVENSRALEAFKRSASLQSAYRYTQEINNDFIEYLYEVETSISEAAAIVATVEFDEEAFNIIKRIRKNVDLIGKNLKDKKSDVDDDF